MTRKGVAATAAAFVPLVVNAAPAKTLAEGGAYPVTTIGACRKTAKPLRICVPQLLLAQADEVIE